MKNIMVFEAQMISGKWDQPLCLPMDTDIVVKSVSASINLIWFCLNIASHQKDEPECQKLALMIKALLTVETNFDRIGMVESKEEVFLMVDELCHPEDLEDDDFNGKED